MLCHQRFQAGLVGLWGSRSWKIAGGQDPVIRCQEGELGEHSGQGRVHMGIDKPRQKYLVFQAAVYGDLANG